MGFAWFITNDFYTKDVIRKSFVGMFVAFPTANFFWAGMVPSIWVWLNLVTVILTMLLNKTSRVFRFLFERLDVDEHPIRSVGFVAAIIGAGAQGIFLIIEKVLL